MDDNILERDQIAQERMQYPVFRRGYMAWRRSDLPKKISDFSNAQLPFDSVLHIADKLFLTESGAISIDVSNPFIVNEEFPVYAHHVTELPPKDDKQLAPIGNYIHNAVKFNSQIQKFNQTSKLTKRMTDVKQILSRKNALSIFSYNPLLYTYMTGRLVAYRKMDLLLKSMLYQILKIAESHPEKLQFIQIPISAEPLKREQFLRAFEEITPASLKVVGDPSYYYMIHLLGIVTQNATTSLFKIPDIKDHLDRIHVILTCGQSSDGIIYNLGDLPLMLPNKTDNIMMIRHVNVMKFKAADLLEDLKEKKDNQSEPRNEDDTTQNLDDDFTDEDIDKFADSVTSTLTDVMEDADDVEDVPVDPTDLPIEHTLYQSTDLSTIDTKSLLPEDPLPVSSYVDAPDHNEYISTSLKSILNDPNLNLTSKQKETVLEAENHYANIDLAGRSIASYLNTEPNTDPSVELSFLEDYVEDKSMTKSSIMDFDNVYIRESLNRDVALVLSSFSGVGMILQDVKEEDEITEFNYIRHYTITFKDPKGKRHTCRFRLPIVSPEGTIRVNGVDYRMTKQQINLPICKVSPHRVNLSSNFNKALVERTQRAAYSFKSSIKKYISSLKKAGLIYLEFGTSSTEDKVPYDYGVLMGSYGRLKLNDYHFTFNYKNRLTATTLQLATEAIDQSSLLQKYREPLEEKYGVFCGEKNGDSMFYGKDNIIRVISVKDKDHPVEMFTIRELLNTLYGDQIPLSKTPSEWVEIKLQDKSWPIAFFLGYRFGLSTLLKDIKHPYRFYPTGKRAIVKLDDIMIPFKDGKLVFSRYPLTGSLILSGLKRFETRAWNLDDFDIVDTYFTLLSDAGHSTNILKGINSFFDLFVDPITREVLISMGEPTTVKGLLYRATEMLSTVEAKDASSLENFRTRGYERFPYFVYNAMAREFARYQASRDPNKSFSINPEAVFLSIVQDPTLQPVDSINPIHDIKSKTQTTYGGAGGRSQQSFVITDRQYPKDGVGILSESVPDSGKVAFNAYMSANPRIINTRGMYGEQQASSDLEPSNILSTPALLMPGGTQDDKLFVRF
jgi:hypothetical protein